MLVAFSAHPRFTLLLSVSAFLVLGGMLVWSSAYSVPSALVGLKDAFESRFPRTAVDAEDNITGIISLGGGVARVRETARIAAMFPRARVVVTGPTEEEMRVARTLSFAPKQLLIEPHATDTFENVLFTKRLVNPTPGERWIVVTSAIHMPRAMGVFSAMDFSVEPWPVFDASKNIRDFWPAVRHELVGLLAFRLLSYTTAFFPGPLDDPSSRHDTARPAAVRDIGTIPAS